MKKLITVQTQCIASLLIALFLTLNASFTFAQTPTTIPGKIAYQGKLLENGIPVTGTRAIDFSIPGTGWTETHNDVPVAKGLYSVQLGSITPIPVTVFNSPTATLEIIVEGTTLVPQVELLSVPYAYRSEEADNAAKIAGDSISTIAPAIGQTLQWDGTAWVPGDVATQELLIPRMDSAQISGITDPASGLQVYNTTDEKVYIYVATENSWKELSYGSGIILPTFPFLLTVFESGSSTLLKANVTIESGAYSKTQTLDSITGNQINIRNGFANYTLTVENAGYHTYTDTFADTTLKSYNIIPLVVELEVNINTVVDYDRNEYQTVSIGNQTWMAENLKTTHYANGDAISDGTGVGDISGETDPKYWFAYNDDVNNVAIYGRLYTWYTVTDSRNVCPTGWHVPTDAEWTTLEAYLGGSTVAGAKLKEGGITHWLSPNSGATNATGFTALPGGYRTTSSFSSLRHSGYWWSTTKDVPSSVYIRVMYYYNREVWRTSWSEDYGLSVRCIKD